MVQREVQLIPEDSQVLWKAFEDILKPMLDKLSQIGQQHDGVRALYTPWKKNIRKHAQLIKNYIDQRAPSALLGESTALHGMFDTNPMYDGDDPMKLRQEKARVQEQLRCLEEEAEVSAAIARILGAPGSTQH